MWLTSVLSNIQHCDGHDLSGHRFVTKMTVFSWQICECCPHTFSIVNNTMQLPPLTFLSHWIKGHKCFQPNKDNSSFWFLHDWWNHYSVTCVQLSPKEIQSHIGLEEKQQQQNFKMSEWNLKGSLRSNTSLSSSWFSQKLTNLHDPSKHRRVVHGAAVPPPLPELVLALLDARLGSVSDVDHVVLVQLAQLPLALQSAQQHRGEISRD